MYLSYPVCDDLFGLLENNNQSIHEGYKNILLNISTNPGFSYNTQIMISMVHTLFKSNLMIAHNLLQNAVDEAKGATRVNIMADRYADEELKTKMKRHVGDELRHSQLFANLIQYTGFSKEEDESQETIESVDHVFDFDDDLKTFICRVHSIEIRSWTMLRLYIDVLQSKNDTQLNKIADTLLQIKADEIQHVIYTGQQINKWLHEDTSLEATLQDCFLHTNRETWNDIANMANYLADNFNSIN